jgi:hypothetical protein
MTQAKSCSVIFLMGTRVLLLIELVKRIVKGKPGLKACAFVFDLGPL